MPINFGDVQSDIKKVLADFFSDPDLTTDITYRKFISQAYDNNLGHTVTTYQNTSLKAIKVTHNSESHQIFGDFLEGAFKVQIGDVAYLLNFVGAPTDLSIKDLIDEGTEESIKVKQIKNASDLVYFVTVEAG